MSEQKQETKTIHFGYQLVAENEKSSKVAEVFHSVASRYDLMNDLMSLGLHRLWKRFAIFLAGVRPGQTVLDVAGGTGDLTKQLAELVGQRGQVYLADINSSMLEQGRDRLIEEGLAGNIHYIQADAEALPFQENTFDCITIAFGLRNVTHMDKALASMYAALKPGGRLLVIEFSHPTVAPIEALYNLYSFSFLPWLGQHIAGDAKPYQYLVESIRMHPNQETLKAMMQVAGYENIEYFNLCCGIVAIHRGYKY
jgi:demethylmenaquinone methyltransferase/2-methoxy-6-polyprenyl-1,4-benzoquinol methylase